MGCVEKKLAELLVGWLLWGLRRVLVGSGGLFGATELVVVMVVGREIVYRC